MAGAPLDQSSCRALSVIVAGARAPRAPPAGRRRRSSLGLAAPSVCCALVLTSEGDPPAAPGARTGRVQAAGDDGTRPRKHAVETGTADPAQSAVAPCGRRSLPPRGSVSTAMAWMGGASRRVHRGDAACLLRHRRLDRESPAADRGRADADGPGIPPAPAPPGGAPLSGPSGGLRAAAGFADRRDAVPSRVRLHYRTTVEPLGRRRHQPSQFPFGAARTTTASAVENPLLRSAARARRSMRDVRRYCKGIRERLPSSAPSCWIILRRWATLPSRQPLRTKV